MKTNETELRSEAAIWSEGTPLTAEYLVRSYLSYVSDCEQSGIEPDDCQRFFQHSLGISPE